MAKKSFGLGIDALLKHSESRDEEKVYSKEEHTKEEIANISKKQSNGIKICLQLEENLLMKFKAVAHWERLSQRELIELLMNEYLKSKGDKFVDNALKQFPKAKI